MVDGGCWGRGLGWGSVVRWVRLGWCGRGEDEGSGVGGGRRWVGFLSGEDLRVWICFGGWAGEHEYCYD